MVEIIPAILTASPVEAKELLLKLEGVCDRAQIDIIDGVFAEGKTIDPAALSDLDTILELDFHLMTKEPVDWVERAVRGGADRIIGQIEQMTNQAAFIGKIAEAGVSVGLAVDIDTPVSQIEPEILTSLDVVLVMSVKAGRGGQEFDVRAIDKVKELTKIRKNDATPFRICVDGGETVTTVDDTHFAGADEIAIGRRLFEGDIGKNLKKFQEAAHKLNPIK
ncbi:hypothetical protein A2V56_02350 [Candidatus Woesebacteria bacterium RBG_19FT_COMBO_42_9]|uniref:Ribulose-phosphate 3-epimerase n=1 Tax=Candidatus Woesebacteria bacterium RBG_16_42_24 TaxID=1802485 RepID=A0A1F7XL85_9BACT|nr:MAG: hypothetical protein A2V97_03170 [Candidatus Woesebacteria bacterium RBG_16_42_24]OGM16963.1 MAG: hypothetical protein A2V56_02350 [Candidatus Woesebacteria bacterium RBG_19FT_COMBO_42_9]OGM68461.1 MAG: hypothetical protein A2985_01535 [Candidatus Woesebacteria bacterium RIFCSPLOWO2_01_FULL_43_11]